MKHPVLFLACLLQLAAAAWLNPRACAGDNCNRAITGVQGGPGVPISRLADCNSYFSATVTPATTYVELILFSLLLTNPISNSTIYTTTVTVYNVIGNTFNNGPTPGPAGPNTPITQTPTAIPSYVTVACDDKPATPVSVRWSSACSCAGATHATTTLPSPVSHHL